MAAESQARARNRRRTKQEGGGPAFFEDILSMAGSLASSRRDYAASQLENLADSVREFSQAMPNMPAMKSYATTAAESLDELATYVVDSEISEMLRDAREFTRRHPLVTFGGSIAAGLVLTQLVQARTGSLRSSVTRRRARDETGSSAPSPSKRGAAGRAKAARPAAPDLPENGSN